MSGEDIALTIGHSRFTVGGREGHAITMSGTLPVLLIRLREGQNVRIHVTNTLDGDTSIHWHGFILPFHMDRVPGVSFPGILKRSTFTCEFPAVQNGTCWYHSHSGHTHTVMARVKQQGGYFNDRKLTLADRAMWARMRMDPTDIPDVTGATHTYSGQRARCGAGTIGSEAAPLTWAQRLKRVFEIDISLCPLCGGQLRVIGDITDPDLIRNILDHVNSRAPPRLPPRRANSHQTPPDLFAER